MIKERLNNVMEVRTSDPDEQRRAKLLNILLLGLFVLTILGLLFNLTLLFNNQPLPQDYNITMMSIAAMMVITAVIFIINRYVSPLAASILFVVFLTLILYFSAPPYESVWGRNMIMLALPIVISSVILRPFSSFVVSRLLVLLYAVSSSQNDFALNYIGILAYFGIALVSWLSANTLEKALTELRDINVDLDAKVEERTKELVLANTRLAEARDTAIEASQYKTELTARVSHELRTPLGSIMGFAEMLWSGYFGAVNEAQKQKLKSIVETTKNLSNLISDWLDQAKLESGKLELYYEWFTVRELVGYVEDITQVLIKSKPIKLNFKVETAVPTQLYGDNNRIQQILINLVSNAIKYTEKGFVNVLVSVEDSQWIIQVKDTGIGISEKSFPTIFESFSQVDGSRTRTHEGFGLGLSIVKQLIDLMDGDIIVESIVGEGSVFIVKLPLIEETQVNEMNMLQEELG